MADLQMRQPPRFVPTLTDVVHEVDSTELSQIPAIGSDATEKVASRPVDGEQAEALRLRVLQHVEGVLQTQLRCALMQTVDLQVQALMQVVRQDLEQLIQTAVQEAIVKESLWLRQQSNESQQL